MVYIPTWEEERALSAIRSLANDPNLIRTVREVLVWRVTTGIFEQSTQKIIKDTTDPLKALEKITDGLQYLYVNTTIQIHFRLVAGFATSLKRIYAVTMTSAIL